MRKFLLFLAIVQAGCSLPKAGKPLVQTRSDAGQTPPLVEAPHAGVYELRKEGESGEPLVRIQLMAKENFGFFKFDGPDRRGVFAVACWPGYVVDTNQFQPVVLSQGSYFWTIAPESELKGWKIVQHHAKTFAEKTVTFVGGTLIVTTLIIGIAVLIVGWVYLMSHRGSTDPDSGSFNN